MKKFTLTAVGRDQTGIVSRLTEVLYKHNFNIEDSSMTRLGSEFAIILIMTASEDTDSPKLLESLSKIEKDIGLSIHFKEIAEEDNKVEMVGNHLITVYGADKEGIVFKTGELLAGNNISITDLKTKTNHSEDSSDIYVMVIEANFPDALDATDIETKLNSLGKELDVHITVKEIEIFDSL